MSLILATAYPSEGISDGAHLIVWVIYALAAIAGFVGLVMRFQGGWEWATVKKLALVAIVLGFIPFAWHSWIYEMDFFPMDQDGTKASREIWREMLIPSLPLLGGVSLLICGRKN